LNRASILPADLNPSVRNWVIAAIDHDAADPSVAGLLCLPLIGMSEGES
jgi:hypothetical protein